MLVAKERVKQVSEDNGRLKLHVSSSSLSCLLLTVLPCVEPAFALLTMPRNIERNRYVPVVRVTKMRQDLNATVIFFLACAGRTS